MNVARSIKKEAIKFNIRQHVILAVISAFSAVFGIFGYLDLKHNASITQEQFSKINPETVVTQKILKAGSSRPVLFFETSSGQVFKRGIYTPNFSELKNAVRNNKQIQIWYGRELNFPSYLKALMPITASPIYQIMANGEIILSFELMRKDHTRKSSIISYVLLGLGIACLAIVCFSLYGIKERIQLSNNINKMP